MNREQRNSLLQELFDHVAESIVVTDAEGKIKLMNPAALKLFGYTQEELVDKTIEFLMPERIRKDHVGNRKEYLHNPHTRSMGIGLDLFALKKNNSEFPVEISLSPFQTEGKSYVMAFIIDITKRKAIEQEVINHQKKLESLTLELKAINERLETKVQDRTKILREALTEIEKSRAELSEALEKEKELNELKSRFLSMASHEFRTPLTTILSSASLIAEYPGGDQQDKRIKHVDRIKSAVNNLNNILGDFLSLSKIEEGKVNADFRKFDLPEMVDELEKEIGGLCKQGQKIIFKHTGDKEVFLDPKLMRNILINLVSNAIKFSDENKLIYLNTTVDKSFIKLIVKDQGIGISKDDREHLFQRFFRGENASNIQGTGLGLNIVSKYIELMNGFIEVDSELEKGTTFTISFPIKRHKL
jgi:PAS domain S-box-containing protein